MRSMKAIDSGIFFSRGHGLVDNKNAKKVDKEWLITWYKEFAVVMGEIVPLRVRRQRKSGNVIVRYVSHTDVALLPAYFTWGKLYDEFLKYSAQKGKTTNLPSTASFQQLLQKHCSDIMIRSPVSNVCDECTAYLNKYKRNPTADAAEEFGVHTQIAKLMREEYRKDRSNLDMRHLLLIMDYSQNYCIPSSACTPSSWYFLSLVNINLFGVYCSNTGEQRNFLYSEYKGGKGSNEVISMLYRVIKEHKDRNPSYEKLTVYADNCVGQNKNNFVVKFLIVLCHLGIFEEVNLKFFVKGHTKNACDRGFGHIRKYVMKQEIWTFKHLAKAVEKAAISNKCTSLEDEDSPFFNYKIPLDEIYHNIKGITSYQIFRSTSEMKGSVECFLSPNEKHQTIKLTRSYDDIQVCEEKAKRIVDTVIPLADPLPKLEKKMDMYLKVRPTVPTEYQDDVLYQQPTKEEQLLVAKVKRARKENRKALAAAQVPDEVEAAKVDEGNASEDFAC
jgi:hypothetical protein